MWRALTWRSVAELAAHAFRAGLVGEIKLFVVRTTHPRAHTA
jgi:hypothetical protein